LCPFGVEGTIRQAVHQLKYNNLRTLALPLAKLMKEYLAANPLPVEVLVPVPLHRKRLKERGHNQSQLLAEELGKLAAMPVVNDVLIRKHYTPPQARTTTVEERWSNVTNAFTCISDKIKDKNVLLIDDVSTSGATINACAKALKDAGAALVWGLVLAREV